MNENLCQVTLEHKHMHHSALSAQRPSSEYRRKAYIRKIKRQFHICGFEKSDFPLEHLVVVGYTFAFKVQLLSQHFTQQVCLANIFSFNFLHHRRLFIYIFFCFFFVSLNEFSPVSLYFPVPDHVRPRVCSLPERPYNPRQSDDLYRLRTFSISKGTVVNCGDSIISRRSRSNTSVNSTNSR